MAPSDGKGGRHDIGGMTFREKLEAAWERSGSLLCIGLDPDPELMAIDDVAAFNIAIIEATSDLVCAYKPNAAFYEALRPSAATRRCVARQHCAHRTPMPSAATGARRGARARVLR
jgi:hypothetical protein